MADAAVAGAVTVDIGGNLAPFEAALARGQQLAQAFDARMKTLLSGSGASAALDSVNASAANTATVLSTITAPASAAAAKIDAVATSAVAAADANGVLTISAKDIQAAMAGGALNAANFNKALAEVAAPAVAASEAIDTAAKSTGTLTAQTTVADASIAGMVAALEAATGATAALTAALTASGGAGGAARGAAKKLGAEIANTGKLSATASAEILRIGNDAARGNFGRLTSAAVVLSTRLGEGGASALTFRNVLTTFGGLADIVFNPIFIALVGIPVAIDLAVKGFEALEGSAETAADVLKKNDDLIKSLASSFPSATAAAKDYADAVSKIPAVVATDQAKSQITDTQNKLNSQIADIGNFQSLLQLAKTSSPNLLAGGGNDALSAINAFEKGGTLAALQSQLARLHVSPTLAPDIKSMVEGLQTSVKTAIDLQNSLGGVKAVAGGIGQENAIDNFKASLAYAQTQIPQLQQQIDDIGKGSVAIAGATAYTKTWTDANITATTNLHELDQAALSAGASIRKLTADAIDAQAHSDLTFQLSLAGLSPAQQKVAAEMRGGYGDNAAANVNSPTGADLLNANALSDFQNAAGSAINSAATPGLALTNKYNAAVKAAAGNAKVLTGLASEYKQASAALNAKAGFKSGASTASEDAKAYQRTVDAMNLQIKALTETDKQKEIDDELSRAKVSSSSAEGQALTALAAKYYDQKQAITAANDAASFFGQTVESGFEGLITGGESLSSVLSDITKSLVNAAIQAEVLGQGPLAGILGTSPTTSGGLGGMLGSLATALFKPAPTLAPGAGLAWAGLPKFAAGTNSAPGGLSIINEQGPELVNLPRGAQVIPAAQTNNLLAANQNGGTFTVENHFHVSGAITEEGVRNMVTAGAAQAARAGAEIAKKQFPTWQTKLKVNGSL